MHAVTSAGQGKTKSNCTTHGGGVPVNQLGSVIAVFILAVDLAVSSFYPHNKIVFFM